MGGHTSSPVEADIVVTPEPTVVSSAEVEVGTPDVGGASVVETSVVTSGGGLLHPARKASASQIASFCISVTITENDLGAGRTPTAAPSLIARARGARAQFRTGGPHMPVMVTGTSSTLLS
jgi:hypothetical protein